MSGDVEKEIIKFRKYTDDFFRKHNLSGIVSFSDKNDLKKNSQTILIGNIEQLDPHVQKICIMIFCYVIKNIDNKEMFANALGDLSFRLSRLLFFNNEKVEEILKQIFVDTFGDAFSFDEKGK